MITEVRVRRQTDETSKVRAYASFTIDNAIAIDGIALLEGENGMFLSFPSGKTSKTGEDGKPIFKDYVFPVSKEARQEATDLVVQMYESGETKKTFGDGTETPTFSVRTTMLKSGSNAKAISTVTVNGAFAISSIITREGKNGMVLYMPARRVPGEQNGRPKYWDYAFPVTKEARAILTEAVLSTFEKPVLDQ